MSGGESPYSVFIMTEVKYIMEKLRLLHPVEVTGVSRREFEYDIERLTVEQFIQCSNRAGIMVNKVMEINAALHEQLAKQAIMNVDRDVDIADLDRIKGRDVVSLTRIGRAMFNQEEDIKIDDENKEIRMKHGINGVKSLKYDFESITVEQFDKADGHGGFANNKMMEINEALHVYLGAYAVANANNMKVEDTIKEIKGKDVILVATLGRLFFTPIAEDMLQTEDISQESSLEEPLDPTQESTIAESEILEEDH